MQEYLNLPPEDAICVEETCRKDVTQELLIAMLGEDEIVVWVCDDHGLDHEMRLENQLAN